MQRQQQQHASTSSQGQINSNGGQPLLKKKRNLPGMPDPDAEIVALSPRALMATNRFICEICNKGFQRDQNLQLHRRGHDLPWKLKQRTNSEIRKRVYICPETSCVHHHPSRALGDLTGIKKHFCRKHGEKKWKCDKCSKKYAVQSDWKAHSKTCGTREYRCDCGILFSRRDSFITHRAFCDALAEESARYSASNQNGFNIQKSVYGSYMPSVGTLSQQATKSSFEPSNTLFKTGGFDISKSRTGKTSYETDVAAVAASWERDNATSYCGALSSDQRVSMCFGSRAEDSQGNGETNQFRPVEEQLVAYKNDHIPTYYLRDQYREDEESRDCRTEKPQDSQTWELPSSRPFQFSEVITPLTSDSRIDFSEMQNLIQQSPNNLSMQYKGDYVDFMGSKSQINQSTNFAGRFAFSSSALMGSSPLFGIISNGHAQSFPFVRNTNLQPALHSQNSATALLQKAAQMGVRTSNKGLTGEGTETVSIPVSAVTCKLGAMPNEERVKDRTTLTSYSSHTSFGRFIEDNTSTCGDLDNSSSLHEERRTLCSQLVPSLPDSPLLNFSKRHGTIVRENFTNLPSMLVKSTRESTVNSQSDWNEADIIQYNCRSDDFHRGQSRSIDTLEGSADPFTRDFLGMTRARSMMETAVSVNSSFSRQDCLPSVARNESVNIASLGSSYWRSASTNATLARKPWGGSTR
ncbi:hypothetical protein O6H91_04G084900 [Diphasiastrum complanatum]|uniref:Uncharacterized protein n=6 Tax=Diphasiastrum complanatum TaxID=34168 RepID=A0ACC2DZA1_DIPCM|nr:hypothetical protein O6H91_04G084900 [Diphasiastrum complanatum]KAJ7559430.1 hypothetical protein O6H91_04G084900 [Diphasiastrum complanatum]KAJ7559431.1 hypothetical protein O6H91_04G084900 [Diphasiastrum complanatum]KAJ7559432.1 hypothetical protein O6H91_04G084900 [Diphasiastrum complanatum]KAJ7559433.1 hypothetical protein O6H91_04G084900 [Diphasiastrum complanatum]